MANSLTPPGWTGQKEEKEKGGEGGVWRRKAKCPEVEEDKEEKEKKFLRAHRPRNQSKMVQEILADLKKSMFC